MDNYSSDIENMKLYHVVVEHDLNVLDPADYDIYVKAWTPNKGFGDRNNPFNAKDWAEEQYRKAELEGYCGRFWQTKGIATTYANRVKKNTKFNAYVEEGTVIWSRV